jgi:hypothetical protein
MTFNLKYRIMKTKRITTALLFALFLTQAFSQNSTQTIKSSVICTVPDYKFSVSTPYLTFVNFGPEETNTHHYEFHFKYKLTPKDKIGIKVATWKLFQPLGMPLLDAFEMKESEFYPGRLKERGIGITYQRMLWKGLFASVEILPLWKTYLDENNKKIDDGFMLYTSYHLGYHISLFKGRFYVEPQVHCNYWPIDTKAPQGFKEIDDKWNNYFLFEPNLYIGIKF